MQVWVVTALRGSSMCKDPEAKTGYNTDIIKMWGKFM